MSINIDECISPGGSITRPAIANATAVKKIMKNVTGSPLFNFFIVMCLFQYSIYGFPGIDRETLKEHYQVPNCR